MLEWIHQNLPFILAGISVGGQYALIAIGYTMVYGILRLINFAHGDIFMVSGVVMVYATTLFTRQFPNNPGVVLVIAILFVIGLTVLLGFCTEKIIVYYADELVSSKLPEDEDEYIKVFAFAPEELEKMIAEKKIKDGKTLMAFYWYMARRPQK